MHEAELDVVALELAQALGHRFERAAHVRLQDEVQGGGLAALDLLEEVLELRPTERGGRRGHVAGDPVPVGAGLADGPGLGELGGHPELVAGLRRLGKAEHLHRRRGRCLFDVLAVVVDQGLHLPPCGAGHDRVADSEGPALDDDRGYRTAADLQFGLEHHPAGPALRRGDELLDLGDQHDLFEEIVDSQVLQRRDLHRDGVAAPRLGYQPLFGELLEHPVRIGLFAVDLVERHDDRDVRCLRVVDRLDGLWHHPVVRGHHQHDDVGHVGATCAHCREGLVARRVDEGDRVSLPLDLVRAHVLGDPPGFAGGHVGRSDPVEEERLAVVDMAHDGDDGWARTELGLGDLFIVVVEELGEELGLTLFAGVDQPHVGAELGGEEIDHVVGERLGGRDHLTLQQEEADHVAG